jgi:hypothetical protein
MQKRALHDKLAALSAEQQLALLELARKSGGVD